MDFQLLGGGSSFLGKTTTQQTVVADGLTTLFPTVYRFGGSTIQPGTIYTVQCVLQQIRGGGATTYQIGLSLGGTIIAQPAASFSLAVNPIVLFYLFQFVALDSPQSAARLPCSAGFAIPAANALGVVSANTLLPCDLNVCITWGGVDAANSFIHYSTQLTAV